MVLAVVLAQIPPDDAFVQMCVEQELTPQECAILRKGFEWREAAVQRAQQLAHCEDALASVPKPDDPSAWDHIPTMAIVLLAGIGAGVFLGFTR